MKDAPALSRDYRIREIRIWLGNLFKRKSFLGIIGGTVSGVIVWMAQDYFTERGRRDTETSLVKTIKISVSSECQRLQTRFASFYDGYPTITCEINVYRLPKVDPALVEYLNARREAIVGSMEEKGVALIRSGALTADAYDKIFSNQYFKSTISRNTTTFDDYFRPLNEMCSAVDVKLSIQQCPYER